MHEIGWRIKKIIKRTNNNRKFELSVHGIEFTKDEDDKKKVPSNLNVDQKRDHDSAIEDAIRRKRIEFETKG